jgi:hypothetical protein
LLSVVVCRDSKEDICCLLPIEILPMVMPALPETLLLSRIIGALGFQAQADKYHIHLDIHKIHAS